MAAQVAFARRAIEYLLAFPQSNSIVLVGHSMGGIVARVVLEQHPELIPRIAAVITLATPHHGLACVLDSMQRAVHAELVASSSDGSSSRHFPPVLSIAGGIADTLIRQDLVLVDNPDALGIVQAVSSAIPYVWAAADHNCIMWCNQLVLRLGLLLRQAFPSRHISPNATSVTKAFKSMTCE